MKAISAWERFAISPEGCAQVVLKGVARNKPIITVMAMAKVMSWLVRLSHAFIMNFARKHFSKWRDKARKAG